MKIVLISIPPNRVINTLQKHDKIDLVAINPMDHIAEFNKFLGQLDTDGLLITYRCPKIIPKEIYRRFTLGAFNIHPSLLPKYPGLNPWKKILEDGLKESGVTLHKISDLIDGGEIIRQECFEIMREDTIEIARNKADMLAEKMITEFINNLFSLNLESTN